MPSLRAVALCAALMACVLSLGPRPVAGAKRCLMRFDVEPDRSALDIGGEVTKPISIPIKMVNAESSGLFGPMFVEMRVRDDQKCPKDADSFSKHAARGSQVRFVQPPSNAKQGSLQVFPFKTDVEVEMGGTTFAELSFYDVALEVLSEWFSLAPHAERSNAFVFDIKALWRIFSGTGAGTSAVLGQEDVQYVDLAGLNTTIDMKGAFVIGSDKIVLDSPFAANFDLLDGDIAKGVEATVFFDSKVVADGYLGCSASCFVHGKCMPAFPAPNTTADGGAAGPPMECVCECGWTGEDCMSSTGYCSLFPDTTSAATVYASSGSSPPSSWSASSMNQSDVDHIISASLIREGCDLTPQECPDNTVYNAINCACDCEVGWTGSNCTMCTNNAACQISGLGKECDTSLEYSNKTVEKHYMCELRENDPIKKFLEGDIRTTCDVKTEICSVRLGSYSDDMPHIHCNITQCNFNDGSANVNCDSLDCDCAEGIGCPDYFSKEIITIMRSAKGIPAGVLCEKEHGEWLCEVMIEGLPITLEGICKQGTCLTGKEDVAIAAITDVSPPGLLLALIGIFGGVFLCLACFFVTTNLWRMKLKGILTQHGRYGGKAVSNILLPGSTFSFEDIRCSLAMAKHDSKIAPALTKLFKKKPATTPSERSVDLTRLKSQKSRSAHHCSLDFDSHRDFKNSMREASDNDMYLEASGGGHRTILHDISGSLQKGLVMAIMGPSGSGKSTLLNILAGGSGHIRNCKVTGCIQVDGQARDQWFHKIAAHVPQEDQQIPTLTVRECIMYSAMLRLPWHWPKSTKMSHVDQVLKELGLKHIAMSQVGGSSAIRGVSGGEKRRVSIGMELVTSPKILFLDEPTSGLDSYTAASIMSTLTKLARNGRMVLLSLHQPSESVFNELDKVLLLCKGHAVYCGDADKISTHFSDLGFPCPVKANIADHVLEIVSKHGSSARLATHGSARVVEEEVDQPMPGMPERAQAPKEGSVQIRLEPLETTESKRQLRDQIEGELTPSTRAVLELSPHVKGELVDADAHQPLDRELVILFWRTWTDTTRHPALLRLHMVVSALVGAASAIIFNNVPQDLAGLQNRAGFIFFTLTFFAFASLTSIDLFIAERAVFTRELRGSYYRVGTYFFAKATLDGLLLRILPACLYALICYWSIGLRGGASHVMVFFATLALFNLAAGSLSMVIAVVSPTAGFAGLTTIVMLLIFLLFGGFLANAESLPPAIGWLQYLSIFYYGFEILFVNEVHGLNVQFDAAGMDLNVKGDLFLDTFNFSEKDLPTDIVALFGIYVGLLLLAYLLLWVMHSDRNVKVKAASAKKEGFKRWCEKIKSRLTSGSKKAPAPSQLQTATLKA